MPPDSQREGCAIRLIAVDLDGTLLRSDSTLAPEGGRALGAAASLGVCVVLTTTRNLSSVRRFAAEIGIDHPVVCTNGAHILASPAGPTWVDRRIPGELAEALLAAADARGWELITTVRRPAGPGTVDTGDEVTVYRQRHGQSSGWAEPGRWVAVQNQEALALGAPIRILNYEADRIPAILDFCATNFPGQYHLETYFYPDERIKSIGIFAPGCDKGAGLTAVVARLGVDPGGVMAIGDNPNDLPMFGCAVLPVAMGNATLEVKRAASIVAPTNDEEGVAWAVRRFVLKRDR